MMMAMHKKIPKSVKPTVEIGPARQPLGILQSPQLIRETDG